MKISRRSWHYRLYRYTGNVPRGPDYLNPFNGRERREIDPPSSLCPYAWSILLSLIGVVVVLVVAAPLAVVAAPLVVLYRTLRWLDRRVGVAALRAARKRRPKREPTRTPPRDPSEPSLLRAFLRAKKDKVCPMIELVD